MHACLIAGVLTFITLTFSKWNNMLISMTTNNFTKTKTMNAIKKQNNYKKLQNIFEISVHYFLWCYSLTWYLNSALKVIWCVYHNSNILCVVIPTFIFKAIGRVCGTNGIGCITFCTVFTISLTLRLLILPHLT